MKALVRLVLFACFIASSAISYAQEKSNQNDAKAIQELAEANMAEVEAGKLAQQKAKSDEVKKFAQHMVDDHGKMLDEVKKLAESKGVKLPAGPNATHKAAMKKLEAAAGDQFDKIYMQLMVKDHQETVNKVQTIARAAKDTDVKAAAEKALPNIKEHLKMAQQAASNSSTGK